MAVHHFRFNEELYMQSQRQIYKYDEANDNWDFVDLLVDGANVGGGGSSVAWGAYVYFSGYAYPNAYNPNRLVFSMNTSEVIALEAYTATLFAKYGPYLYRADQHNIYYSADPVIDGWVGPFPIGSGEYPITGMSGMGDSMYVATAEALYRFAPGDVVEGVTAWGGIDFRNGSAMATHEGTLYISVNGRIMSFTPDGQLVDVWVNRDDDVLRGRIGRVWGLVSCNNWLVALIEGGGSNNKPTAWALLAGAWHHMATLPTDDASASFAVSVDLFSVTPAYYDRETSNLFFSTTSKCSFRMYMPDYALNPYNDSETLYMPRGWIEQDRFYGGQYLLNKDWESVRVVGENLSASAFIRLYWQDEDSTAWELLDTVTSEDEVRWEPPYTTRPDGRWIRFGALLGSNSGDVTPRVRAIIIKFLPKTVNKIQDNVTIRLRNYIEMPDGDTDSYTAAEQWAHLHSLIERVHPIIYEDPAGDQYEVQITTWNRRAAIFANEAGENRIKEYTVMMTLRQINDDHYVEAA
jgi:hypothetical protein